MTCDADEMRLVSQTVVTSHSSGRAGLTPRPGGDKVARQLHSTPSHAGPEHIRYMQLVQPISRHLALSTNNIEKISSLAGMDSLKILSLGRNLIKKVCALAPSGTAGGTA